MAVIKLFVSKLRVIHFSFAYFTFITHTHAHTLKLNRWPPLPPPPSPWWLQSPMSSDRIVYERVFVGSKISCSHSLSFHHSLPPLIAVLIKLPSKMLLVKTFNHSSAYEIRQVCAVLCCVNMFTILSRASHKVFVCVR